jgi:aminoglycoside phosphotransferase (APT) family kinase protein
LGVTSEATDDGPPPSDHLNTSTRDEEDLRLRLEAWLGQRPDVAQEARIDQVVRPEANGMSSETLLFDASWGGSQQQRFVARLRPAADAFPVFPTYDLERQVRVMRLVGERSAAPVPRVRWYEPDDAPVGAEFFVMDRVEGQVPPDVMPYVFDGSWVSDATPEQRAQLQARSVDLLAAIHGVEATPEETAFLDTVASGSTPLRRHFEQERAYYDWVRGDVRLPVIERAFDWLEAHWPEEAEAAGNVVCWGDARIGNVLYQDFEPQAVLDWEMATLAPRELDVGWFIFLHRFFDDIAADFGMAGLPDFLQRDAVAAQYAERTGHEPRDLDWFITYAATRHGSIMARTMGRRVHFGEAEMPDDPEEMVMHRKTIAALIG